MRTITGLEDFRRIPRLKGPKEGVENIGNTIDIPGFSCYPAKPPCRLFTKNMRAYNPEEVIESRHGIHSRPSAGREEGAQRMVVSGGTEHALTVLWMGRWFSGCLISVPPLQRMAASCEEDPPRGESSRVPYRGTRCLSPPATFG
ncbi:hypothetical protein KM043_012072 [Ampulex compressa]|nr:hypothetical protein KM043_012072 [Ampulex compressa]